MNTLSQNYRPWLRWVLIGGAVLGLIGVACCGFAVFGGVRLFQGLQAESNAIRPTLRAFLDAGHNGDLAAALRLFANNVDVPVSAIDLDHLFTERPAIFAAYTDVMIDTINVTRATNGTNATIAGSITYAQGTPPRSYTATLRKEGDIWKLVRIQFPDGVGQ
jgi:ketosteroid isomerase-like protein